MLQIDPTGVNVHEGEADLLMYLHTHQSMSVNTRHKALATPARINFTCAGLCVRGLIWVLIRYAGNAR